MAAAAPAEVPVHLQVRLYTHTHAAYIHHTCVHAWNHSLIGLVPRYAHEPPVAPGFPPGLQSRAGQVRANKSHLMNGGIVREVWAAVSLQICERCVILKCLYIYI